MKIKFGNIRDEVISNTISGVILALIFVLVNDFFFNPPNLNGRWIFKSTYEDTNYSNFENMEVYYSVSLQHINDEIIGFGEMIYENSNNGKIEYIGDNRSQIEVSGHLKNNYFKKDTLVLSYTEDGHKRTSSTFQNLIRFDDAYMSGNFDTTIADSKGSTEWWKNKSLRDIIGPK